LRGVVSSVLLFVLALLLLSWSIILYPDFWKGVRDLGLPVPYCTTEEIAIGCQYIAPASLSYVHKVDEDPVYVTVTGSEPVDFLNTLCDFARSGRNVLAVVYPDAKDVGVSLTSCGVKVKYGSAYYTSVVSPDAVLIQSDYVSLYTDCEKAARPLLERMKRRWSALP